MLSEALATPWWRGAASASNLGWVVDFPKEYGCSDGYVCLLHARPDGRAPQHISAVAWERLIKMWDTPAVSTSLRLSCILRHAKKDINLVCTVPAGVEYLDRGSEIKLRHGPGKLPPSRIETKHLKALPKVVRTWTLGLLPTGTQGLHDWVLVSPGDPSHRVFVMSIGARGL